MPAFAIMAASLLMAAQSSPSAPADCESFAKAWKRISSWNDRTAAKNLLSAIPEACSAVRAKIANALAGSPVERSRPKSSVATAHVTSSRPKSGPNLDEQNEYEAWNRALSADTDSAYADYVSRFSEGKHVPDAQAALRRPHSLSVCNRTANPVQYAQYWFPVGNLNPVVKGWTQIEAGACGSIETNTPSIGLYAVTTTGSSWGGTSSDNSVYLCVAQTNFAYTDLDYCPETYRKVAFWRYEWRKKSSTVDLK